jgi:acyl carrier protein
MPQTAPERTLEYRVMEIFADVLGLDGKADIDPQSMIRGELGVDSVDFADVCAEIEQEFDIEVEADVADKWVTVADVIRYVQSKLPVTFSQADVDAVVARAKELGAGPGLCFKLGHLKLSNYAEPHGPAELAMLIVGGWDEKWDLIHATQAVIEFLSQRGVVK